MVSTLSPSFDASDCSSCLLIMSSLRICSCYLNTSCSRSSMNSFVSCGRSNEVTACWCLVYLPIYLLCPIYSDECPNIACVTCFDVRLLWYICSPAIASSLRMILVSVRLVLACPASFIFHHHWRGISFIFSPYAESFVGLIDDWSCRLKLVSPDVYSDSFVTLVSSDNRHL